MRWVAVGFRRSQETTHWIAIWWHRLAKLHRASASWVRPAPRARTTRCASTTLLTLGCQPSHLALYSWPVIDPEPFLLAQDLIFVGGGNTRNLLALWQAWDLPRILRQAMVNGCVVAGIRRGANCWFEQGITDSIAPTLGVMDCLGFLPGCFCPHYDSEVERRPAFQRLLAAGEALPGYAADNGVAFHFVDGRLHRIVSSRPTAAGYQLTQAQGQVVEEALEVVRLASG